MPSPLIGGSSSRANEPKILSSRVISSDSSASVATATCTLGALRNGHTASRSNASPMAMAASTDDRRAHAVGQVVLDDQHVGQQQRERADLGMGEVHDAGALEHQHQAEGVEAVDAAGDEADDERRAHQRGLAQRW